MSSSTFEVGKRLVELCKVGEFHKATEELYADSIVSVETFVPPGQPREVNGKPAVLGKGEWWMANHTVHSVKVEGPFPHDDQFIVTFDMDVTPKVGPMANKRMRMHEAGLYTVKDGKVVHEVFFYNMGGE